MNVIEQIKASELVLKVFTVDKIYCCLGNADHKSANELLRLAEIGQQYELTDAAYWKNKADILEKKLSNLGVK